MTSNNLAFDVVDSSLLKSLSLSSRRAPANPFQTSRLSDSKILLQITQQQKTSAVQKFCTMCEHLNIDAFHPHSIHIIVATCSRHNTKPIPVMKNLLETLQCNLENLDWDHVEENEFESMLVSNSDWAHIMNFLEFNDDGHADLDCNDVIRSLQDSLVSCQVANGSHSSILFACRVLLFMSPRATPASRMVENLIAEMHQNSEHTPPHDLEFRVMRALTKFYDHQIETAQIMQAMHLTLSHMRCREDFHAAVQNAIVHGPQEETLSCEKQLMSRLSLREYAKHLHVTANTYHGTFASWVANQRFPLNTSLKTQQSLYFVRTQEKQLSIEFLQDFFDDDVLERAFKISVDQIDPEPVIELIKSIRVCKFAVDDLVNFRTKCLVALSMHTRKSLTMANVMQLYVCCYQHSSIREQCWRSVLPVWGFSLAQKCEEFVEANDFNQEAVFKTMWAGNEC